MTGTLQSLILLAVAGVLLWCCRRTRALDRALRPIGLVMLLLAAAWYVIQDRFDLSILSVAEPALVAGFDRILQRHAIWIACGLGVSLLLIDTARQPDGTGPVLLAVAGLGAIAAGDSLVTLIVGLFTVALATVVLSRTGDRTSAHDRERILLQSICLGLSVFGLGLLIAWTGVLSLAEMRAQIPAVTDPGEDARQQGGLAIAASVLLLAGLSGFTLSFWLPWDVNRSAGEPRIHQVAAAALLPATASVVTLLRLIPGVLSVWNEEVITVVMVTALLLIGVGLLGVWLQSGLREMLGWACVVHMGLWCTTVTVAGWDSSHSNWSLATESGLPGGSTATLIALLCDLPAMLGVWSILALLAGERNTLQHPDELCGLLRQRPLEGMVLSVCLLSLCGAPFLAGFWGRYCSILAMFGPGKTSSITGGYEPHYGFLVLLAVSALAQLLLCGLYLRLLQRIVLEHPLGRIRPEGGACPCIAAVVLAGAVLFIGSRPMSLLRAMMPQTVVPVRTLPETPGSETRDDESPPTAPGSGGQQAVKAGRNAHRSLIALSKVADAEQTSGTPAFVSRSIPTRVS